MEHGEGIFDDSDQISPSYIDVIVLFDVGKRRRMMRLLGMLENRLWENSQHISCAKTWGTEASKAYLLVRFFGAVGSLESSTRTDNAPSSEIVSDGRIYFVYRLIQDNYRFLPLK